MDGVERRRDSMLNCPAIWLSVALVGWAIHPTARCQTIGQQQQVNSAAEHWNECTVVARLSNGNHVVVSAQNGGPGTSYAISQDGGANFVVGTVGPALVGDPALVLDRFTPVGQPGYQRIWLSGLSSPNVNAMFNDPDQWNFNNLITLNESSDKPWLAIGPAPGGSTAPRHYVICSRLNGLQIWGNFSDTPTTAGTWNQLARVRPTPSVTTDYNGWGAQPVVLDDGRVVVVVGDADPTGHPDGIPGK